MEAARTGRKARDSGMGDRDMSFQIEGLPAVVWTGAACTRKIFSLRVGDALLVKWCGVRRPVPLSAATGLAMARCDVSRQLLAPAASLLWPGRCPLCAGSD